MAITHHFKGSAPTGYGYFAYIEAGQLVIGEDWGREGGILYRGPYRDAGCCLKMLQDKAQKLYNSITKYYNERDVKEETITHQFKDSRDCYGYGYHGFIENNELVLCHDAPREGGVLYRGSYEGAAKTLASIKRDDQRLYNDIENYFRTHKLQPKLAVEEKTSSPAGVLWKARLCMDNGKVYKCLVRGLSESSVIQKLMPPIPTVLTIQSYAANVFAVRSDRISAIEFVEEW